MNTPVIQCQYIGRSNKEFKVQKIREVKIRDFTESEMTHNALPSISSPLFCINLAYNKTIYV